MFYNSEALFLLKAHTQIFNSHLFLGFVGIFLGKKKTKHLNITTRVGLGLFFSLLNLISGFAIGSWQVPGPVKPGFGTRGHAELHSSLKLLEKFSLKLGFKGNIFAFPYAFIFARNSYFLLKTLGRISSRYFFPKLADFGQRGVQSFLSFF